MKSLLNQTVELEIQRLGIHGEGIGSVEGFTIFVEGALPGERVQALIFEVRKNYGKGRSLNHLRLSTHRIAPPCPVFGKCGGCQIMHLEYAEQLKFKRQRVVDALERIGHLTHEVLPCVSSPLPLHYRNKIQLPYQGGRLGLYAFNSHDLVEIDSCFIHCPLGEKAFEHVRRILQSSPPPHLRHVLIKTAVHTSEVLVILVTREDSSLKDIAEQIFHSMPEICGVVQNVHDSSENVILGKIHRTLAGEGSITDLICGLSFKVSPASFFQVNPAQVENLYRTVVKYCHLSGKEVVLDAYCGVGTLSLLLAPYARQVIGIEAVPQAIIDAQSNAASNYIQNVSFICNAVEKVTLPSIDCAVINPPRKGCDPHFISELIKIAPSRVVYVSCDPATLARDLVLLKEGGYHLKEIQPFDMFPQTVHVETAVLLMKD